MSNLSWSQGYTDGYNYLLDEIKERASYVYEGGWDFEDFFRYLAELKPEQ